MRVTFVVRRAMMNAKKRREMVAAALLEELTSGGEEEWFYLSIVHTPTCSFVGGYVLQGRGKTDAWLRAHALDWIGDDCETLLVGPIEPAKMGKIRPEMRYRKLTANEARTLGQ